MSRLICHRGPRHSSHVFTFKTFTLEINRIIKVTFAPPVSLRALDGEPRVDVRGVAGVCVCGVFSSTQIHGNCKNKIPDCVLINFLKAHTNKFSAQAPGPGRRAVKQTNGPCDGLFFFPHLTITAHPNQRRRCRSHSPQDAHTGPQGSARARAGAGTG